ncbi:MAG: hypothetical protein J5784_02415 [Muribaculaceae bacterium]|nr:hypothetical protein [Muribaculaceae bacterium]
MKSLKLVWKFVKGIFSPRKSVYNLSFVYEPDDRTWYIDIPWPGNRYNLAMVAGSDKLLSFLDEEKTNRVNLKVKISKKPLEKPGYVELFKTSSELTHGAYYDVHRLEGFERDIWICPVTLTVLGCYPNYIYFKKQS